MSWTPTYHKRNLDNLEDLAPNTRVKAKQWYQWCFDNKVDVLIYETIRSVATQKANVAKGASQTMKSYHLVGQALDFVPIVNGKDDWNGYKRRPFLTAIEQAERLGFESGHRWGWDSPHLQYNYKGYDTDNKIDATHAKIKVVSTPKSYLEKGDSGMAVKELQALLRSAGYNIAADGDFGPATEAVVLSFQKENGLTADGIAGKQTLDKLKSGTGKKEEAKVAKKTISQTPSPRFKEAVSWAKEKGISDGSNPQEPVTREQVMQMIYNDNKRKGTI
jgi:peptidoglycan L-alanyl-D-glutamate endopeptidase CwlK